MSLPSHEASKKAQNLAMAGFVLATIIWGWGFIFQKFAASAGMSSVAVTLGRGVLATVVLSVIFFKTIKREYKKGQWKVGAVLGFLLAGGNMLQSYGIEFTTPGKSAFITSSYVIWVPVLYWILTRKKMYVSVGVACVLSLIGIGILSLDFSEGFSMNYGDVITLISSMFFAMQIVVIGKYAKHMHPIVMAVLQCAFSGLFSAILFLGNGESFTVFLSTDAAIAVGYLGVISTGIGFTVQVIGQRYVSSAKAGVLLSCESLFGAIFSVIVGYDVLSFRILLGGAIVFIAVILPDVCVYLKLKNSQKHQV